MEKNKSFFNELGLKKTIDKLVNHIAKLYQEDEHAKTSETNADQRTFVSLNHVFIG